MRLGRSTALVIAPLVLLAGFAFGMARRQSRRAFASLPAAVEVRRTARLAPSRPGRLARDATPAATPPPSNTPVRFVAAAMTDSVAGEDSLEAVIVVLRMGRLARGPGAAVRQRPQGR